MNWRHLQALLWLRWRLSWNQLNRGNRINLILGAIAVFGGYAAALGVTVAGFFLGWKALGPAPGQVVLITWDVLSLLFVFAWVIGFLTELQRSEAIDLQRLLHLPISLPQLFFINYIASHATFSVLLALPGMVALSIGMSLHLGPRMLLLIPLAIGFILMVSAWSYFLRGWLVSLMVNQRRKRTILMMLTIGLVLTVQLPNLYFNVLRNGGGKGGARRGQVMSPHDLTESPEARLAHTWVPALWLGNSVARLRDEEFLPALAGGVGLWGLALGGLACAYRSTIRFYEGGKPSKARVRTPALTTPDLPTRRSTTDVQSAGGREKQLMVEWKIPWLRDDTAGLALASIRSLTRAPELRMAMLGPLVMLLMFGGILLTRSRPILLPQVLSIVPTGMIAILFFSMLQLLLNQFGFDRSGFRALVLLPTPRSQLLLAKNLSLAPFICTPALLALIGLAILLPIPWTAIIATPFQLLTLYFLASTVGNLFSILAPFRINPGSLKPTKNSAATIFLSLASHLTFPLLCIPVFAPPVTELILTNMGIAQGWPINLLASPLITAGAAAAYGFSLAPLGDWLEQREQKVLLSLTQEVE